MARRSTSSARLLLGSSQLPPTLHATDSGPQCYTNGCSTNFLDRNLPPTTSITFWTGSRRSQHTGHLGCVPTSGHSRHWTRTTQTEILALGLVFPSGEVVPHWSPFIGGQSVLRMAAVIPEGMGAALITMITFSQLSMWDKVDSTSLPLMGPSYATVLTRGRFSPWSPSPTAFGAARPHLYSFVARGRASTAGPSPLQLMP